MTTQVSSGAAVSQVPLLGAAIFAMALGAVIIFVSGHLQTTALHAAAHDVRHATGFPCH